MHASEKTFYEDAAARYQSEYSWSMGNDLRTIERLLLLEVQMHRVQTFLTKGADYQGVDFDAGEETALRRAQKELGAQISDIQNDLGVTKSQRDKMQEDSVGAYLTQLKIRAKAHGVKREKELGRGIELIHELFAVVGAFKRSNDAERARLELPDADAVLTWIEEYVEVEFKAVDDYFREHDQKFWIRSQ